MGRVWESRKESGEVCLAGGQEGFWKRSYLSWVLEEEQEFVT